MAFNWANVIVPPTGSSGLDSGDHTAIDEDPPWATDECFTTVASSATEVAIFTGFDLSLAGGEKKGFHIWARMRVGDTAGFAVTITLKQDTTTLWTSDPWTITTTAYRTFVIPVPDASFVGSDIDNLSLEFSCENLGGVDNIRWAWLRISKSPFTTAQEAVLPSTLVGQDFVCYRAADIGVLGGADAESVLLLPDSSGKGRHAVLRAGTATYQTDAPVGIEFSSGRFVGALGFDTVADAITLWNGNKIFHAQVYPTNVSNDGAVFSAPNVADFIGVVIPGHKHLLACDPDGWTLMSGDGTSGAHFPGSVPIVNTSIRVTEWVQASGGNEHMWDNDDATPTVDASSGDNPFGYWSIGNRETDDRAYVGRIQELWFIEGTGITEAEIDTARDEWVAGLGGGESFTPTVGALRTGTLT